MLSLIEKSRKHLSIFYLFLFVLSVVTCINIINTSKTSALSGSEFKAGRIIDDAVFNNKNSMSVGQIQEFLNSKVPSCDTNGAQMYNGTQTRAQWAAANGRPAPPYTCLKDYTQNIPTVTNGGSDLCKSSINGGVKSSAQIILDVSQACNVNPQVLIVLLQKEQSLISDTWPWPNQYQAATGYGCPDTAPCDAEYYGFFNQVYQAAKAFRRYEANPNSFNYKANRNNNIYYNPNLGGCGSSNVFIENQATASLYIYTPYQPNAAALNNLYGTGDGCSAYGNRNFWRMFNDWFGSTYADAYQAQPVWQSVFTDSTKTTSLGWNATLRTGQTAYVVIQFRNSGSSTWYRQSGNFETMLGTTQGQDRFSLFCTGAWLHPCNRPARLNEASVAPGQIGTFEFPISAPGAPGVYNESFGLAVNGVGFFPNSATVQFTIQPELNSAQHVWQSVFTDSTKSTSLGWNATLRTGQTAYAVVQMRNTGNTTWTKNGGNNDVMIGTVSSQDRFSLFCNAWLYPCNRPARLNETSVAPGQIGTFEFPISAPGAPGFYNESFGLVVNGKGYFPSYFSYNFTVL